MSVDQVILAAKLWRQSRLNTAAIAKRLGLPEATIYNNLWRIRGVASAEAVA